MKGVIYIILNKENGKFYLGSTNSPNRREKDHFSYLRRNAHVNIKLQNAFNKYGESAFEFKILYESDDIKVDEQKELDNMDYSKTYNIATTSVGGNGNIINHPNRDKIYKKIGDAHRGKAPINNIRISVEGVKYESYHAAHKVLNIPIVTIRYRCLSKNASYKDWYILGQEKCEQDLYKLGDNQGIKIMCDGVEYPSYNAAAKAYGITDTSIKHRVKSKNYPNFYLK